MPFGIACRGVACATLRTADGVSRAGALLCAGRWAAQHGADTSIGIPSFAV
jgi:hypothetical protein